MKLLSPDLEPLLHPEVCEIITYAVLGCNACCCSIPQSIYSRIVNYNQYNQAVSQTVLYNVPSSLYYQP